MVHLYTDTPKSTFDINHEISETNHEFFQNDQSYDKSIKKNFLNKKMSHIEIADQSNDLVSTSPRIVIDKKDLEKVVKLVQACKQRQEKLSALGFNAYEMKKQSIQNLSENEIRLLSQVAWDASDKINQQIARLAKQEQINNIDVVLKQFSSTEKWLHSMLADQLLMPRTSAEADQYDCSNEEI